MEASITAKRIHDDRSTMEQDYCSIPEHIRKEYIEVESNIRLHVTDGGYGKPIVLLHGWPLSDEMFEYQYNDLISSGFRVIGITMRGFGRSSHPYCSYNYDIFARDIGKVLEKLDIHDALLGGFSIGGAIAIRCAAIDQGKRISKLALFAAAAPIWTRRPDYKFNLTVDAVDELIALNNSDRPQLLLNVGKIFAATETSLSPGINNWLYAIGASSSSHAMAECLTALRDIDLREDLPKITIPTIIMHGKKDKICSFDMAEQLKLGLINSRIVAFDNSGHALFLEETGKFNTELIAFAKEERPSEVRTSETFTYHKNILAYPFN